MHLLEQIRQAVMAGESDAAHDAAEKAMGAGHEARAILDVMVGGMDTVGEEWQAGNMFIPEVMLAANALHAALDVIRPFLSVADAKLRGRVVIGTVKGDLHDIGKNLVAMMLEGASFEVHDLGVDVSPADFVAAVKEYQPELVAMSALLTTTLPFMRDTVRSLEEAGLRASLKVLVGGAPVTEHFAASIGADGYAPDGATAVAKARELVDGLAREQPNALPASLDS